MKYFDHDTDACKDELIQALRLECGGAAVDSYWAVLELIYREETDLVLGENQPLTKSVTHWLCTDWETLKRQFSTMAEIGLIDISENPDGMFTLHSERASENIEAYRLKSETARQNGRKGGRKAKANRKLTERKPKVNPTLTKPLAKEKEKERVLDNHKGYPNTPPEGGADAEGSAPPPDESRVPSCPLCSKRLRFDPSALSWTCDLCGDVKEPVYREASE